MSTNQGQATKSFGTRGLSVWGGRVAEEYLTALKDWLVASKIYREMQDDAVIGTLLDAVKAPLLAAEFDVIPGGDTPGDDEAAHFLWDNMNRMKQQTWRSHVQDMLEALDFGFAIAEIVLEKREDGRLWIGNLDPRGQETLWKWEFDEFENVSAFIQRDPIKGTILTIPSSKIIHVTFRGRKGNPMGKPLLRSLYRLWKFLKNLENLEGIGIERDVGGTPILTLPENFYLPGTDITTMEAMLDGLRMDERTSVILEHGMDLKGYSGGSKIYDVGAVIERKKKEILMRMFAQFLMLGMDQVGTQALVKGSQDFFSLGLIAVQQFLLEAWQQQLVPFLFTFNTFPGMTELPILQWSSPGTADIMGQFNAYVQGISAQVFTPSEEDEDHFRGVLDLPDKPEGAGLGPEEVPMAFGAPPGPPPRPGLVWNPDTNRWRKARAGEDAEGDGKAPPEKKPEAAKVGGGTGALDFQQEDALVAYSGKQYTFINSNLRGGTINPQLQKFAIDPIDKAIAEHGDVSVADTTLFRGVGDWRQIFGTSDPTTLVGTEFVDDAFTSFSTDDSIAKGFRAGEPPPVILRTVSAESGLNGLAVESLSTVPEEKEILLPRALHYEITNVSKSGEFVILDVKVSRG